MRRQYTQVRLLSMCEILRKFIHSFQMTLFNYICPKEMAALQILLRFPGIKLPRTIPTHAECFDAVGGVRYRGVRSDKTSCDDVVSTLVAVDWL